MRDVIAGALFLTALVLAAVIPALSRDRDTSAALASGAPPRSSAASPAAPPRPRPTPLATAPASASTTLVFPTTERPLDMALPATCAVEIAGRHSNGLGMTWRIQCGSASANRAIADAAIAQGWHLLDGNPPIGVGLQNYTKGALWMQIAYRLDGPALADPFTLVQYVGRV